MPFAIHLEIPPQTPRAALLSALGLDDDGGGLFANAPLEVGRAATGSTAVLEPHEGAAGRYLLTVPLVRAPWSGPDVIPSIAAAAAALGGRLVPDDALGAWQAARAHAIAELAALCESQGAPLPPTLPRAHLDALHQWLVAIDAVATGTPVSRTVFCLDPRDGSAVRLAVRLPRTREARRVRLPPVGGLLADLDESHDPEAPRLFSLHALGALAVPDAGGFIDVDVAAARAALAAALDEAPDDSEEVGRYRFVSPVEILDVESLAG